MINYPEQSSEGKLRHWLESFAERMGSSNPAWLLLERLEDEEEQNQNCLALGTVLCLLGAKGKNH